MSTCTQHTSITVAAPWLSQAVSLTDLHEKENMFFMKVTKGDNKVARILSGSSIGKARKLSSTDFLATIQRIRNDEQLAVCKRIDEQQVQRAVEDLGMDIAPNSKKLKTMTSVLPHTLTIRAPALENHDAVDMTVLTGSETSPLFVEVTSANIDYLHAAFVEQVARPPASADTESQAKPRGVHWCSNKQAYRVNYKSEGKLRQKYFRPESQADADVDAAIELAKEFLADNLED